MMLDKAMAKKHEVVAKWEKCFGKKLDTVINEAGLKWIWDTDTSVAEVIELLDAAAVGETIGVVNSMFDHIFGGSEEEPEQEEQPEGTCTDKYRVIVINHDKASFIGSSDDVFGTYEEADEFRHQKALSTALTLENMKVLKVS